MAPQILDSGGSLLRYGKNYSRKKFLIRGPRGCCHKSFYGSNLSRQERDSVCLMCLKILKRGTEREEQEKEERDGRKRREMVGEREAGGRKKEQ